MKFGTQKIVVFLAQGLGSGKIKWAPGTFGSLAGMLVFYALIANLNYFLQFVLILAGAIFGIFICTLASYILNEEDPSSVVWDEWIGMWIALFTLPLNWFWYALAFALFRLLDITKPSFIGYLDRKLESGLGIMLDDIVAGLLVFIILQLTNFATITLL